VVIEAAGGLLHGLSNRGNCTSDSLSPLTASAIAPI
jgi:hypothetical protein